ncbi:retron Ec67 family RNA-directed DNA polymerase/endonuclease [Paraburkholderia terricola]|uniref:retron Ec67 family RNA-directed DNA polymerase/endonuclease n=1 Tax=Paraburkholderia terricola TaxID=169427 RepID=UPI00286CF711|nr:retron Ec67 family RNA-directed DNA polymerase/endonuclease [Paraburkholderia terricola]
MSSLQKLKAATARRDLAIILDVSPRNLAYILYKTAPATKYTRFTIPKRHGGEREISAPSLGLKLVQQKLASVLQDCSDEIALSHVKPGNGRRHGIAHGFKRHHTIMTNGRVHVTRRFVFNADLHDFFGTINFGRVRGFFIKDRNFALHPDVATVIAQIACFENKLPQGSPCSPVISNLLAHPMDILLSSLAAKHSASYTRYADDLTFSTNNPTFPPEIATLSGDHTWVPGAELDRLVSRSGFAFNPSKTRLQYRDSRQEVTGLTVNQKVNVPATYRYTVRAMAHSLFTTGAFEFVYKKRDANGAIILENRKAGENKQLLGMLSYIDHVDRFNHKLAVENGREFESTAGRVALFRRFLYFDLFHGLREPMIVCEGKTDNVYLRCAIKALSAMYPSLVEAGAPPKLKVRFYKYAETRTGEITELTGGVGGICKLLKHYHTDVQHCFKAPAPRFPVIVLIDNDKGAHSVYEAIAGITKKKKPQGLADFIHVTSNLYVVPTPRGPNNSETAIEDFFDEATLKEELNGRKFDRSNHTDDKPGFYGKGHFARDVVAKKAGTINFDGFKAILDRIIKVTDDYQAKLAKP